MNTDQNQSNDGSTQFLNFSDALNYLRWGERIARRSWYGRKQVRAIYTSTGTTLRLESVGGTWIESRIHGTDLMAEDWFVV